MPNATLEKGLIVLEAMAREAREFSLTEISELTGLTSSNAHKLLSTLSSQGYVLKIPPPAVTRSGLGRWSFRRRFLIGWKFAEWG